MRMLERGEIVASIQWPELRAALGSQLPLEPGAGDPIPRDGQAVNREPAEYGTLRQL